MTIFTIMLALIISIGSSLIQGQSSTTLYHVGVILDIETPEGKIAQKCMDMSVSDFYGTSSHANYRTKLILHTRHSSGDPLNALSLAVSLLETEQVQAIIGPQTSGESQFLVQLADKAGVPVISFSATSPFLSREKNPYFLRVATSDKSAVGAIVALVQLYGWRELVLIHEDSSYGNGVVSHLLQALQDHSIHILRTTSILPMATEISLDSSLKRLVSMPTRIFIVHISASLASRFFLKAKELGMMGVRYAWIVTDGITNSLNLMDQSVIDSMEGVVGISPYIPPSEELNGFTQRWRSKMLLEGRQHSDIHGVNVYCLWAYDAVWALAKAAERVNLRNSQSKNYSNTSLTYLNSFQLKPTGLELLKELLRSQFKGLSGEVQLVNGQAHPSAFEIKNVIGAVKTVGFFTAQHGITRALTQSSARSTRKQHVTGLPRILWPGLSSSIPKGHVIPMDGKKLRVGVPVNSFAPELLSVSINPETKEIKVSGFCIEAFEAAVAMLPYSVAYEFIPFTNSSGLMAGTYDDLIYEVYKKEFDAAVGDITIAAERSQYVDFTLPFTEPGVAIIVPIEESTKKSMWIFLKPLEVDLWLVICAFFFFTGFVVWIIEHEENCEFRGTIAQQIGTDCWYSFSTLVFSQRERLMSNLSKFVVIIWLFAVLILTSSYTASLSSILTAHQLQQLPNGASVGYNADDVFKGILDVSSQNFTLQPLRSMDDYADALRAGKVSAIIDEIPYIRLFLAKYSSGYTMVQPSYLKSNGFGFAFTKGSLLVPDVSAAIAKLREQGKLNLISRNWFENHSIFPAQDSTIKVTSLDLYSFRGLFLITGITFTLAIMISYFFMNKDRVNLQDHKIGAPVAENLSSDNVITSETTVLSESIEELVETEDPSEANAKSDENA